MIKINYAMNEKGFDTTTEFGEVVVSGYDEHGFRPYFLMVTSVVGCAGGRLRKELETLEATYDDIDVEVDVTRKLEEANRIEKIHLTFGVKSDTLTPEILEKAMQETREKSSMLQTVKGCIEIKDTLIIK